MGLRAGDGVDLIASGIEGACDPLYIASLAGGVPSLVSDNDGDLLAVELVVKVAELVLKAVKFFVVLLFGYSLVIQGDLGELGDRIEREDILPDRCRERMVLQCGLNSLVEEAKDLELCPFLVARVDDIPGSCGAVRVFEVLLIHIEIFLVVFVLVQVVVDDSPAGVFIFHEVAKAPFLLFFADVEEEFHHQVAVVSERALRGVDAADALFVLLISQLALHQLRRHFVHPVSVEECEFSGLRDLQQISVQEGIALLFGRRGGHGPDAEEAGVDTLDHSSDHASFARGAPAFENDYHRKFSLFDLHLIAEQLLLGLLEFFLKLLRFGLSSFDKIF